MWTFIHFSILCIDAWNITRKFCPKCCKTKLVETFLLPFLSTVVATIWALSLSFWWLTHAYWLPCLCLFYSIQDSPYLLVVFTPFNLFLLKSNINVFAMNMYFKATQVKSSCLWEVKQKGPINARKSIRAKKILGHEKKIFPLYKLWGKNYIRKSGKM